VEELSVQLQLDKPITASGSILTLPAATLDLQDWMGDQREFLPVQYDDWQQVIGDYRDSVANSGPKVLAVAASHTAAIDALLPNLISSSVAVDNNPTYTVDVAVRADILSHLQRLDTTLSSDAAIVAAWRDLVSSCQKLHRTVEEVFFRRDTLWAIAVGRGLDVSRFGVFRDVCAVLTDDANAVRSEQDRAGGVEPELRMPDWEPSGLETWRGTCLPSSWVARTGRSAYTTLLLSQIGRSSNVDRPHERHQPRRQFELGANQPTPPA
jgi:hypothetical protein